MRFNWLLGICLAYLPLMATAHPCLSHYTAHQSSGQTTITLRTTQATPYHVFALESPARLVVDFDTAHLCRRHTHSLDKHSLIKKTRAATWKKQGLRLVFELKQPSHSLLLRNHSKKNSSLIRLSLAHKHSTHPLSRIEQAAKPIWLKRVTPKPKKPTVSHHHTLPHQSPQRFVIVIDPGHGGKDPGATGPRGHHEKDIVLAIAKRLKGILNREPYYRAILTRHHDHYLTLRERLKFARDHHANLFISVHADAFRRHGAHGASVYALSERGATSEAAHWLASKENDSELLGGVNLDNKTDLLKSVLIDLSQSASVRESMDLGKTILHQLDQVTNLHHHRVEEAAFVVLKSPDIPSLLIETGFLSNPSEERKLIRPTYQERLAMAVSHGITLYMHKKRTRGEQVRHSR